MKHLKSITVPERERQSPASTLLVFLALLGVGLVLAAILVPHRVRAKGRLTGCKSNLKNIGTALEMYSTDWAGCYPRSLNQLTPEYLKTIPTCPDSEENSYYYSTGPDLPYNTPYFQDYYIVSCEGDAHTSVNTPAGFPQYDGLRGLYER